MGEPGARVVAVVRERVAAVAGAEALGGEAEGGEEREGIIMRRKRRVLKRKMRGRRKILR